MDVSSARDPKTFGMVYATGVTKTRQSFVSKKKNRTWYAMTGQMVLEDNRANATKILEGMLQQFGPVAVAIATSKHTTNFDSYTWQPGSSNIYTGCKSAKKDEYSGWFADEDGYLDHAVTLVGYGKDDGTQPPNEYWIIKNSFGSTDWGISGYMYLPKGGYTQSNWGFDCGILDDVSTVTGVTRGVLAGSSPPSPHPGPHPGPHGRPSLPLCDYRKGVQSQPTCESNADCNSQKRGACRSHNSMFNFDFMINNQQFSTDGKKTCERYGTSGARLFECRQGRCKSSTDLMKQHVMGSKHSMTKAKIKGCWDASGTALQCGGCKNPNNV